MAMFTKSKSKPTPAPAIHSLLGKGMLWKGEIHCEGHSLRVEGTVEGAIHSEGEVTVAPSGLVKGTIHARHLIVTGRVEGVFRISECLEVHGTGHVEGELEFGSLVVDEGGIIQGLCTQRGTGKQVFPSKIQRDAEPEPTPEPEQAPTEDANQPEPEPQPLAAQENTQQPSKRHRKQR